MGKDESKLSFLRTPLRFYCALAILDPQICVEQFGAENISLLSRCLVLKIGYLWDYCVPLLSVSCQTKIVYRLNVHDYKPGIFSSVSEKE